MENDILRRLLWSGLVAATGALASLAAHRLATVAWRQMFKEDPPE